VTVHITLVLPTGPTSAEVVDAPEWACWYACNEYGDWFLFASKPIAVPADPGTPGDWGEWAITSERWEQIPLTKKPLRCPWWVSTLTEIRQEEGM
jgi:hypothetical protein